MLRVFLISLATLALIEPARVAQASTVFNLPFSAENVLPSAEGLDYVTETGTSETDVFSVGGGALHLNTAGENVDATAYYYAPNGFDHTLPTTFDARLRVLSTGSIGLSLAISDSAFLGGFTIAAGSSTMRDTTPFPVYAGTFPDPQEFHMFSLNVEPMTGEFDFLIDGALAQHGTLSSGSFPSAFYLGDTTPTGGNVEVEFDYVNYRNAAVPEPASWLLLVISSCMAFFPAVVLCRRRTASPM